MSPINLTHAVGAILATGLLLAAAPASAVVAAGSPFNSLYVLGDSLSDNGNVFAASGGTFPPAPYYQGRFSNGPVAVEVLAAGLGLGTGTFFDFAVGGATTGADGSAGAGTGMLSQLAGYQAVLGGGAADSTALYTVWGGANDLRANPSIGTITTAINNLTTIVSTLHTMGARNFLLPNLPDLGLTPEAREAGISGGATFASEVFNTQLSLAYGALAAQWSDEHFYYFDAMGAQRAITSGSPGNGFSNVSTACIGTAGCATALYFDSIHPTAVAHQILSNQMLAAVPEPQTMLMLAAGLLVLLGVAHRRRA